MSILGSIAVMAATSFALFNCTVLLKYFDSITQNSEQEKRASDRQC